MMQETDIYGYQLVHLLKEAKESSRYRRDHFTHLCTAYKHTWLYQKHCSHCHFQKEEFSSTSTCNPVIRNNFEIPPKLSEYSDDSPEKPKDPRTTVPGSFSLCCGPFCYLFLCSPFIFLTVYSAKPTLTINATTQHIMANKSVATLKVCLKTKSSKNIRSKSYTTVKNTISIYVITPLNNRWY